jgi:hypothetical protein
MNTRRSSAGVRVGLALLGAALVGRFAVGCAGRAVGVDEAGGTTTGDTTAGGTTGDTTAGGTTTGDTTAGGTTGDTTAGGTTATAGSGSPDGSNYVGSCPTNPTRAGVSCTEGSVCSFEAQPTCECRSGKWWCSLSYCPTQGDAFGGDYLLDSTPCDERTTLPDGCTCQYEVPRGQATSYCRCRELAP